MNGLIDEATLYGRALYPSEILAIYNAGSAGKCQAPPPPTCLPAPTNLVSWWRAEGDATDAVGGNSGTLVNSAGFGPGEVGQAFAFGGGNQVVVVSNAPSLNPTSQVSLEAWVRLSGYPASDGIVVVAKEDPNDWGTTQYYLGLRFIAGQWVFQPYVGIQGNLHNVNGATPVLLNTWYHAALTYDGVSLQLYVDGNLDGSAPVSGPLTTGTVPLTIGGFLVGPWNVNGLVDEVSLYDRALSAAEIQSIYHAGSAGKCVAPNCVPAPTNLVSWWRGEGSALDSWNRNKGELHGATFAPGEAGQAFSFNGTSDYVHIPVAGNLPSAANLNVGLGDGLTLDAWVNPSDVGNGHPVIEWSQPVGGPPYGVHLWVGHPSRPPGYFYANIADTNGNWHVIDSAPGLVQPNMFQHVAVTYNQINGLARLFLNGAIVTETNLGIFTPQTSYEVYFGERPPGDINSRFYAGLIDEIDIFSRALEPAEIQAIYNAGSAGKCVVNRLPVANNFPAETVMPGPLTIPATTFIAACSAPDGHMLSLDSVSTSSTNGGTVSMTTNSVVYTPTAGFLGADRFGYTISDGNGGTATAYVLVQVDPSPFAAHMLPPAMVGSQFQLNFSGYPGATYTLQRAESLAGPWIDLGAATVDGSGNGTLLDANPPAGSAFYRAVYH